MKIQTLSLMSLMTVVALTSVLSGCLQTRSAVKEQEEKQVMRKQVTNLQQATADVNSRFNEIDDDLRKTTGRIEALDSRLTQIKERAEKNDFALENKLKEQDTKFAAFREEMQKMQAELSEAKAAVAAAHEAIQAGAAAGSKSGKSGGDGKGEKNTFPTGEAKFEQKDWRDAIFAYEEYRKNYPKGRQFVAATYKIGICFQELGMNDDAKLFYEEVIAKAPKSKEAERAKARLKSLAKKK